MAKRVFALLWVGVLLISMAMPAAAAWEVTDSLIPIPPNDGYEELPTDSYRFYFENSFVESPSNEYSWDTWYDFSSDVGYVYVSIDDLHPNDFVDFYMGARFRSNPTEDVLVAPDFSFSVVSPDVESGVFSWNCRLELEGDAISGDFYQMFARGRLPSDYPACTPLVFCYEVSSGLAESGLSLSARGRLRRVRNYQDFALVFDSQGGSDVETQFYTSGQVPSRPADPTRSGYQFKGWYTDKAGTVPYYFTQSLTSDLVLYAKWQQIVSVDLGDGSTADLDYNPETGLLSPPQQLPEREGEYFAGYYKDAEMTIPWDFSSDQYIPGETVIYPKFVTSFYSAVYQSHYATSGGSYRHIDDLNLDYFYWGAKPDYNVYAEVFYSVPDLPSGRYLVNADYYIFNVDGGSIVYSKSQNYDLGYPILMGMDSSSYNNSGRLSFVLDYTAGDLIKIGFGGIPRGTCAFSLSDVCFIPVDAASVDEMERYGIFSPLVLWMRNFFDDWSPGAGAYDDAMDTQPQLDDDIQRAENYILQQDELEQTVVDGISFYQADVDPSNISFPVGLVSALSFVGATFMTAYDASGDYQFIVTLSMTIGLALLILGRGVSALSVAQFRRSRLQQSRQVTNNNKGGGG